MSAAELLPKPGDRVRFRDGDSTLEGICNGEPQAMLRFAPEVLSHVPVYVRESDRCLIVAVANLLPAEPA